MSDDKLSQIRQVVQSRITAFEGSRNAHLAKGQRESANDCKQRLLELRQIEGLLMTDSDREIERLRSALKQCLHVIENGVEVRMMDQWAVLRQILPDAVKQAKEALGEPEIPSGVYYAEASDNFYERTSGSGIGMGEEFYKRWIESKDRFPKY